MVNIAGLLIMLDNLQLMRSKIAIQKLTQATGDLIGNSTTAELQKFLRIHHRTIQKQLQMSMIKKYLKKDIYIYISPEKRQEIIDELTLK